MTPPIEGDTKPSQGGGARWWRLGALAAALVFAAVTARIWYVRDVEESIALERAAEKRARARGSFRLTTLPEGATVTLRDSSTKKTPAVFEGLRPGTHSFRIELGGYEARKMTVEVSEDEVTDLGVVPMVREKGSLQLTTKPLGAIFEVTGADDFRQTGLTPGSVTNLPTGTYQILLKRAGWLPRHDEISITPNKVADFSFEFGAVGQLTPTLRHEMETRGRMQAGGGDYPAAATTYMDLITAEPTNQLAHSNLGVVLLNQGKLDDAEISLRTALDLNAKDTYTLMMLGVTQSRKGKNEEAIQVLKTVTARQTENAEAYQNLGVAYLRRGSLDEAEKIFLKALTLKPDSGEAHFNLAMIYASEKPPSLELARLHYKKARALGVTRDDELEKLIQK